jgi:hypothetical protein
MAENLLCFTEALRMPVYELIGRRIGGVDEEGKLGGIVTADDISSVLRNR